MDSFYYPFITFFGSSKFWWQGLSMNDFVYLFLIMGLEQHEGEERMTEFAVKFS